MFLSLSLIHTHTNKLDYTSCSHLRSSFSLNNSKLAPESPFLSAPPLYNSPFLTLLVAVALEPGTTGTLVTCTDR